MRPPPFAFACSESRLSFAAFEREGEGLVLSEHRSEELPGDTFQHGILGGPPREPRGLEERIQEFVSGLDSTVREASLVLPDAWLRTAFAGVDELPRNGSAREEVLRWKLRRLVPFRVDELRVRAVEVQPLAGQAEARRVLLGFGIESLLSQLETAFASAGVHLGRISNRGLSAFASLAAGGTDGAEESLRGLVLASEAGYTLVFARRGEPALHRFKTFTRDLPASAWGSSVSRDLRLTRTFLEDHFPDNPLGAVVLAAPEEDVSEWTAWLEDGLERTVEPLTPAHLVPLRVPGGEAARFGAHRPSWPEILPLAGAACLEVAA